jgi:hypothetical protein
MVTVIPVVFEKANTYGDFGWMITQAEYKDVLFLFNDNQEQFLSFLKGQYNGCTRGGGNAIIRPYSCSNPPRSVGIPTGSDNKGYSNLEEAKPYIDAAFKRIKQLLLTNLYRRIMYSADKDCRSLGSSIFSPSQSVKEYILNKIELL